MRPLFSILHSSARPHQWRKVYDAWISAAAHPELVEYVLCVDERWGFHRNTGVISEPLWMHEGWEYERGPMGNGHKNRVVWNNKRRCYVDGVNCAAQASTGRILIVNADDQYPCEGWDEQLTAVLERLSGSGYGTDPAKWPDEVFARGGSVWPPNFVIEVSTGTPQEHERGILVMPILSRIRYERLGYVLYPEYESMYADNEFCEHARQDGCIINARHLFFPHRHALIDPEAGSWKPQAPVDEQYQEQNRPEAFELGNALLKVRRAEKFDPALRHDVQKSVETVEKRTIALCLSGEHFHWEWVHALLRLHTYLGVKGFQVWTAREYTSNVYVTREQIRKVMMQQDPQPDLFLWLDDDNPAPTPEQFDLLLKDLEENPGVDGVTAWCYIYNTDSGICHPSCGTWSPDGLRWRAFDPVFFPHETKPRAVECTGFPCFLMKRSALEKAGDRPFLPILDERLDQGISGEDLSFCSKAQANGAKFLVDPRVRVRHLKTSDAVPSVPMPSELQDVKIAVMMRVKNEARWIERCLQSYIPLAGENVFVMDDESTDGTLEICRSLGVNVYRDPFAGEPLDETRDKDWLLTQVKAACAPDWILCVDGDEELEPDGAEMIRRVLSASPRADVYCLGFLFLWDSVDQFRIDGRYSGIARESLFRANSGIHFKSYYEEKDGDPKCHVGLHCGNAPVSNGQKASLAVNLLHYGYLFREDRVRKYRWYRQIDPDNPYEDNYRHMVIGDLPELPAESVTQFGGPLKLQKLTPRMVPHFEPMPEPLLDKARFLCYHCGRGDHHFCMNSDLKLAPVCMCGCEKSKAPRADGEIPKLLETALL